MWEESPIGKWTLEVQNDGRSIVELKAWSLAFLGTTEAPQPNLPDELTKGSESEPLVPAAGSVPGPAKSFSMPEQHAGDVSSSSKSSDLNTADKVCESDVLGLLQR